MNLSAKTKKVLSALFILLSVSAVLILSLIHI